MGSEKRKIKSRHLPKVYRLVFKPYGSDLARMTKLHIVHIFYLPQSGDKKIKPVDFSTSFENYKNTQPTLPDINNRKCVKVFGIF